MSDETTIRRLKEANPFPDPVGLRRASPDDALILAAIDERSDAMSTKQARPITTGREPTPRRGLLIAAATAVAVVLAGALVFNVLRPEVAAPDGDAPVTTLASQWVEAMNSGDLQSALAVLSHEASCDLPTPRLGPDETCEQHLGYLIAIDTHIETTQCRDVEPFRCTYQLTSGLHATMGYPGYSLPMSTTYSIDEGGKLIADFFGTIDPTTPYMPAESGELWAYMQPLYPEFDIDATFGPSPYTAEAGIAAMEAAAEFNGPARITQRLQDAADIHSEWELQLCAIPHGVDCSGLFDFFAGIGAEIHYNCDPATARDGVITCPMTIDSDLHEALGSSEVTSEATIEYRGGKARALRFVLSFAADEALQESFMDYATDIAGLFDGDRSIWRGETAAGWLEAARTFAGN